MGQSVKVTSLDALRDFRETMVVFCERTRDALTATQMESRRLLDWLQSDRPAYWERQVREREADVAEAQAEWHRVKMMRAQDYKVDEVGPKRALERAKTRLAEAEEKVERVRYWGRVAQRAVEECEGRTRRLAELVEGDPPGPVLFLDRAVGSLDNYLKLAPPTAAKTPSGPAHDAPTSPSTPKSTTE